jgi:hypothetical protein
MHTIVKVLMLFFSMSVPRVRPSRTVSTARIATMISSRVVLQFVVSFHVCPAVEDVMTSCTGHFVVSCL